MAAIPLLKMTEMPVLIGFQWSYSLIFSLGSTAVNLDLFNVKLAIQQGLNKITPTITIFPNGLAKITLTGIQTTQLSVGIHKGHVFLEEKTTKDISFVANVEIEAVLPIPS